MYLVGSFGASAVLLFAVTESKLAQPRNVRKMCVVLWVEKGACQFHADGLPARRGCLGGDRCAAAGSAWPPANVACFGAAAATGSGPLVSQSDPAAFRSFLPFTPQFVGGQILGALVGLGIRHAIHVPWVASPLAMALSLTVMQLTSTTHPPGGCECHWDG